MKLALLLSLLLLGQKADAQPVDSLSTGFMTDAAEEVWNDKRNTSHKEGTASWKHLPVRQHKGYYSFGITNREQYEYFRNYLWGIGAQDKNGYWLHRFLGSSQLRWSRHLRIFSELQNSVIAGRNGGPRPVQDLNRLSLTQLFGEVTFHKIKGSVWRLRIGKQALHYGRGTLLDIRDVNVRRSFIGAKGIYQKGPLRADLFLMEHVQVHPGYFDDRQDRTQQIAGLYVSHKKKGYSEWQADGYLLHMSRSRMQYHQGIGSERRNTVGAALTFRVNAWSGYTELDGQWGKWQHHTIGAWKVAQAVSYSFSQVPFRPQLTVQGALSSGDQDSLSNQLQTFHPLYPRAVYYGFLENVGSSNVALLHPKLDFQSAEGVTLMTGYYRFWRQNIQDGLYAGNGAFLFPAVGNQKRIGSMWDMSVQVLRGSHWVLQGMVAYYKRADFLHQTSSNGNITYAGLRSLLRL